MERNLIYNPATGNWVNATGRVGRKLIGNDLCRLYNKKITGFTPTVHQLGALQRFTNMLDTQSHWRGLLLLHGLGRGKTCSYSLCIDEYLSRPENSENLVYIFTTGSLRNNFLEQYCQFCGKNTKNLGERFKFYTYNYSFISSRLPPLIENSLIIIDEVHHVINGKRHQDAQLSSVYDVINNSQNSYIVCGSGTPLLSNYEELFYLMELLIPGAVDGIESYRQLFTIEDGVFIPINDEYLAQMLQGSIHNAESSVDLEHYPAVNTEYTAVPINPGRIQRYLSIREDEISKSYPPRDEMRVYNPEGFKSGMTRYYLAISMLQSRQESNFSYPLLTDTETAKELNVPDKTTDNDGWISEEILASLDQYGEKILAILNDIVNNQYKHVIYTQFKTYHGAYLIGSLLEILQIPYLYFTGDMNDADRQNVLSQFNNVNNLHGENFRVLIYTSAGAEGINLLEVRKVHILEQYISSWAIKQAMGRAIRYNSHIRLPPEERNVTVVNYMLTLSGYGEDGEIITYAEDEKFSSDYVSLIHAREKDRRISYLVNFIKSLP